MKGSYAFPGASVQTSQAPSGSANTISLNPLSVVRILAGNLSISLGTPAAMSYLIICSTATLVAALTLFSGFGLGMVLMPMFAIFFPVEIAVAATAVVHLANNLFKLTLVGKNADLKVVARFALTAALFAAIGAFILEYFSGLEPIVVYTLMGRDCTITPPKLVIACLITIFAFLELSRRFDRLAFDPRFLPLGGALSGFFGGLSGHQGALRSAFLIRAGLDRDGFIGTSVVSAVVVDLSRLIVYGVSFFSRHFSLAQTEGLGGLILAGTVAAFLGSFVGSRMVKKVTMRAVRQIVGGMLLLLAVALGAGLI